MIGKAKQQAELLRQTADLLDKESMAYFPSENFHTVADLLEELARQLEAAQPKWISVEDELPKKWRENDTEHTLVNYQVYSPRYGVDIGNYVKPAGRWVIMGLPVDDVTHWMPLPSAPKEE